MSAFKIQTFNELILLRWSCHFFSRECRTSAQIEHEYAIKPCWRGWPQKWTESLSVKNWGSCVVLTLHKYKIFIVNIAAKNDVLCIHMWSNGFLVKLPLYVVIQDSLSRFCPPSLTLFLFCGHLCVLWPLLGFGSLVLYWIFLPVSTRVVVFFQIPCFLFFICLLLCLQQQTVSLFLCLLWLNSHFPCLLHLGPALLNLSFPFLRFGSQSSYKFMLMYVVQLSAWEILH